MRIFILFLFLFTAESCSSQSNDWNRSVESLLFDIHLSKYPLDMIGQLSADSQLKFKLRPLPIISRTSFVFQFKRHPAIETPFDSAFIGIDTSSYTSVLPYTSKKRDAYSSTIHLTFDFPDSSSMRKADKELLHYFQKQNLNGLNSKRGYRVNYLGDNSIAEFTNEQGAEVRQLTFIARVIELSDFDGKNFFNHRIANRIDVLFSEHTYK